MRLTAATAARYAPAAIETAVDRGRIYWAEPRTDRTEVRGLSPDGPLPPIPGKIDARTRVHGYGGGAIAASNGALFVVNDIDRRLYRCDGPERSIALAPASVHDTVHYADCVHDASRARVICIEERHHANGWVENLLVAIADDGSERRHVLARGDFVAAPRIDPGGRRLAWISWSLPDMPWDRTRLWVADLDDAGLVNTRCVASDASIVDPQWGVDGELFYLSDAPGYWMLHAWNGIAHRKVATTSDLSAPQLRLNFPRYAIVDRQTAIAAETIAARTRLIRIDLITGSVEPLPLPYVDAHSIRRLGPHQICFVGASEETLPALVRYDLVTGREEVLHRLHGPKTPVVPPIDVAIPTADGSVIHAFLYADPASSRPPPLIVNLHGGPVNHSSPAYSPITQFWLQQGYSWLDLNYRGSSGYGTAYRHALRGKWGELDWRDAVTAARHAIAADWTAAGRLVVRGASAGGFTALNALANSDVFAAGASYFGVADAARLPLETHKFESGYLNSLIGPWPEAATLYTERSPLNRVAQIHAPVIFFQGMADTIVPPEQTRAIVEQLRQSGRTVAAHYYPHEGHGFRSHGVRTAALAAELAFYDKLFAPG
jgi:dipeptidyl aminopeptidase/acylaminoacyl peptidase